MEAQNGPQDLLRWYSYSKVQGNYTRSYQCPTRSNDHVMTVVILNMPRLQLTKSEPRSKQATTRNQEKCNDLLQEKRDKQPAKDTAVRSESCYTPVAISKSV